MIYSVKYSWYETSESTLVEGPEVEDWQGYCSSFLGEATDRAIAEDSWVGWPEIVEQVIEILKEKGYKLVKPMETIEATFWGANIIDCEDDDAHWYNKGITLPASAQSKVIEHNKKMEEDKMRKKS